MLILIAILKFSTFSYTRWIKLLLQNRHLTSRHTAFISIFLAKRRFQDCMERHGLEIREKGSAGVVGRSDKGWENPSGGTARVGQWRRARDSVHIEGGTTGGKKPAALLEWSWLEGETACERARDAAEPRASCIIWTRRTAAQFRQAIINSDCSPASQRDPPGR